MLPVLKCFYSYIPFISSETLRTAALKYWLSPFCHFLWNVSLEWLQKQAGSWKGSSPGAMHCRLERGVSCPAPGQPSNLGHSLFPGTLPARAELDPTPLLLMVAKQRKHQLRSHWCQVLKRGWNEILKLTRTRSKSRDEGKR